MPSFDKSQDIIIRSRKEVNRMNENTTVTTMERREMPEAASSITVRRGGTTYLVGLHFSSSSKETIEEKVKKILSNEVEKEISS